jgi:hypothetical protein
MAENSALSALEPWPEMCHWKSSHAFAPRVPVAAEESQAPIRDGNNAPPDEEGATVELERWKPHASPKTVDVKTSNGGKSPKCLR